jgi:ergothioneine biosynthesis protein EgtB
MLDTISQRSQLLSRLHEARVETDALFRIVKPEFLFERPISERHRLAFYIGHLEAFDWNLLGAPLRLSSDREILDKLFAFGIDPVDGALPNDQPSDWPPLGTFYRYRDQVRAELDARFNRADDDDDAMQIGQLLEVAIEHRQMHAETLSYLLHQMPFRAKRGETACADRAIRVLTPQSVRVPAGRATLGLSASSGEFGWDNEFEAHAVDVPAFVIDKYKVTNAQYVAFVNDGGYSRREFWKDEDWVWRTAHAIEQPAFWLWQDGAWFWRSMFDAIPLPRDWPVYVSHAEASAYTCWAGRALPTEVQWQRAAFGVNDVTVIDDVTERERPFDPYAVDDPELIASGPFSVVGMHGNGWEWTSTVFSPFAGFRRLDFYPGYSEPFFDGKHFVLKGGSVRTAASMLRPSFRNWFQSHYPYVYAGFRCVDR